MKRKEFLLWYDVNTLVRLGYDFLGERIKTEMRNLVWVDEKAKTVRPIV